MSELEIINAILNGEKEKFEFIMDRYHNELFKYIYNVTGDYDQTEDLLQETFMTIYKNLKMYNSDLSSFRTWIYRITSNQVKNYFKSKYYKQKKAEIKTIFITESNEDIESKIIKEKQVEEILSIIKTKIKRTHQEILLLHFFSDLSVKEIATIVKRDHKTVYKAIKSSVEKIKKEVSE